MTDVEILSPAPFLAARTLFAASGGEKAALRQAATYQLGLSDTLGLAIGGELLVVVGFFPKPADRAEEIFMAVADPARARPHVGPLFRAMRLRVRARLQNANIDRLIAWTSSRPDASGHRLMRALGSVASPETPSGGLLLWELRAARG